MQAAETLAIAVVRCSFGFIKWHQEEVKNWTENKENTVYGQHYPRANIAHLCSPRREGGRGLMQTGGAYIPEVMKLMVCVESKGDPLIQIFRTHQHHAISTLLQTVQHFKEYFQSEKKLNR